MLPAALLSVKGGMVTPDQAGYGSWMRRVKAAAALLVLFVFVPAGPANAYRGSAGSSIAWGAPVIAAAGDIACDPNDGAFRAGYGTTSVCRQRYTSNTLVTGDFAAVLPLGDTQYDDGAYTKFLQSYDKSWGRVKARTRPAVGNHEYGVTGASGYFRYFGKLAGPWGKGYYSYDVGTWHLIALNSNCWAVGGCGPGSSQERWLTADLAAHRNLCTLAYWHHPRFSSGPHGNSTATAALWQDLYDAGADVVLSAHDHGYERFAPQDPAGKADPARGIRQFVVGTGGRSLYSFRTIRPNSEARNSTTFGVLTLTLYPFGYAWKFVPEAGKTYSDAGFSFCH